MSFDDVGVVVIGRNEGERLIKCLQSINVESDSVVYVDSGSTDGSVNAAKRLGAHVVALDLARPFTAARARNEGLAALRALRSGIRFVQFVDGDCELVEGWLESGLQFIAGYAEVAVVCGRRRERYPDMSVYNRLSDVEWDTPVGEAAACGGDSIVRVEALESVGGFRQQLIAGEEPELCIRLRDKGWKIWRLDAEMTRHDIAMTRFGQWWRRGVRGGHACAEVLWMHRRSPHAIWRKEVVSATVWGGLLPLAICIGALVHPAALAAILVYPVRVFRIALRRGIASPQSWVFAIYTVIAQFAIFQGIATFCWRHWRGESAGLIEYKQAG